MSMFTLESTNRIYTFRSQDQHMIHTLNHMFRIFPTCSAIFYCRNHWNREIIGLLWFTSDFLTRFSLLISSIINLLYTFESFSWLCSWMHTISSAAPSSGGKKYSIDFKPHLLTLLRSQFDITPVLYLKLCGFFSFFLFFSGRKWSSCSDMCLTAKGVSHLHEGEQCVQVWDLQVGFKNAQLLTAA